MPKIHILLMVLSLTFLLSACASKESGKKPTVSLETAQQDCYQQSQSMFNQTIDPANPGENKYFSNCMQAKYDYSLEEIAEMSFEVKY